MLQEILFASEKPVKQAFEREGRNLAYYTSAETALSILENEELWLTNVAGMNDSSECQYALMLLRSIFLEDTEVSRRLRGIMPRLHSEILKVLDGLQSSNILTAHILKSYVACFSGEDADDFQLGRLSMWRGYGRSSPVRLLFKGKALNEDGPDPGMPLTKVLYGPTKVEAELSSIVEGFENASLNETTISQNEYDLAVKRFVTIALLSIKHPAFAEEREWRLIYHPDLLDLDVTSMGVHPLRGRVEQVQKLSLAANERFLHDGLKTVLHSVTIGPCDQPLLVANALGNVLAQRGLHPPRYLRISNVPYREP